MCFDLEASLFCEQVFKVVAFTFAVVGRWVVITTGFAEVFGVRVIKSQ